MAKVKKTVSEETVAHVAKLARLNLNEAEKKEFMKDMNDILAAFDDIRKVKTNAKPSFHPLEVRDVFRKDDVEKGLTNEQALANTRHKEKGFFKGPKAV